MCASVVSGKVAKEKTKRKYVDFVQEDFKLENYIYVLLLSDKKREERETYCKKKSVNNLY